MEDQTPEVVLSPQKPKYNLALWIVVGFATLATGVGIGLAMGKYLQPASSTTSASTIIPSPNPFPTEIPMKESDPTADWKTSKNIILGASFKYPNDWIISETETYTSVVKNPVIATVVGVCPGYSFLVSKYDPATNYARADKIVKGELDGQTTEVWENIDKCSEGMVFVNQRPTNNIKPKYVISFISANSNSKMVFDQILSTFKFLDQNVVQ